MGALKYTDTDLRTVPELLGLAIRYARDYRGEFEFMVAAKAAVDGTGTLPLGVARGVLNCMRVDPHVASSMPPPRSYVSDDDLAKVIEVDFRPHPTRRAPEPPKPKQRKQQIRLKSTIRGYGWSTHVSARKVHLVDPDKSGLYYVTYANEYRPDIRFECGSQISRDFVELSLDIPHGYEMCARCLDTRAEKVNRNGEG